MIKYFAQFVDLTDVTDVNYNGSHLWVDDTKKGRYCVSESMDYDAIYKETIKLSNQLDVSFNPQNPLIEKESSGIRYSIIHPSVTGRLSISIRMIPALIRIDLEQSIEQGYATASCFEILIDAVRTNRNILVSGLPGAGKTELIKFLGSHIDPSQRIITIEDNQELHYHTILPHHDVVSIQVSSWFTYRDAIIASLRQRPDWLMISEVRGDEAIELMNAGIIGTHFLSTIHAKNVEEIPQRLQSITGFEPQRVLRILDIGVHVARKHGKRYIESVCEFDDQGCRYIYRHEAQGDVQ